MRFLFVYQDCAEPARRLLDELGVRDVTLVIARKNADAPTVAELSVLKAHQGACAAACQISRKYRKNVAQLVSFTCEPKKFRIEDQQLREWLVPIDRAPVTYDKPSVAFRAAAHRAPFLVLHPDALKSADELARHRWAFATLGADLLARYASGESLGALRGWKAAYGVDFAANGRVCFKYRASCGTDRRESRTEWHLKEGDKTTRESAARVYFDRVDFSSGPRVLVFYVGPHPDDGEYAVEIALAEE